MLKRSSDHLMKAIIVQVEQFEWQRKHKDILLLLKQ